MVFQGDLALFVQIRRQVRQVNASGSLLAGLDPRDRDLDLSGQDLPLELLDSQVTEVVGAYSIQRDDGEAVVLGHEKEQGIHQ